MACTCAADAGGNGNGAAAATAAAGGDEDVKGPHASLAVRLSQRDPHKKWLLGERLSYVLLTGEGHSSRLVAFHSVLCCHQCTAHALWFLLNIPGLFITSLHTRHYSMLCHRNITTFKLACCQAAAMINT